MYTYPLFYILAPTYTYNYSISISIASLLPCNDYLLFKRFIPLFFLCIFVCLNFSPYIRMIIFHLATPYFQLKIQTVRSRVPRPPPPPLCNYYFLMCVVSRHLVPGTRCGGGGVGRARFGTVHTLRSTL